MNIAGQNRCRQSTQLERKRADSTLFSFVPFSVLKLCVLEWKFYKHESWKYFHLATILIFKDSQLTCQGEAYACALKYRLWINYFSMSGNPFPFLTFGFYLFHNAYVWDWVQFLRVPVLLICCCWWVGMTLRVSSNANSANSSGLWLCRCRSESRVRETWNYAYLQGHITQFTFQFLCWPPT